MDPARRWVNPELGGGTLLDLGVYPLTLLHHLAGPTEEFEAIAHLGTTGVDLETMVISRHPGNVTASCISSFLADGTSEAVIGGSEGRLRLHARFHHPATMTFERRVDVAETIDTSHEGHGFRFEIAEVERCIRSGLVESPLRPHAATLALLSWMDAIRTRCDITHPKTLRRWVTVRVCPASGGQSLPSATPPSSEIRGGSGIRTHGTREGLTGFQDQRLRPLGHPSGRHGIRCGFGRDESDLVL